MQKTILVLTFLFAVNGLRAQDPYLQNANAEVETAAKTITERYTPELVLSGDQLLAFEGKITEFMIRKSEVDQIQNISTRQKLRMLRKVSKQETAEMQNILTGPQLRKYVKIKKTIQPVYVVVKNE